MSHDIHFGILAGVRLTAKELTTQELVSLRLALAAGWNPKECAGYEKAQSLFTEADGTRIPATVLEAFEIVVKERLDAEK